jgi:hypothetical protein
VHATYEGAPWTPTTRPRFAFEPHVAQTVFEQLPAEAGMSVYFGLRLSTVMVQDRRITKLVTTERRIFVAPMFIDASYEGDLMAVTRVRWVVGREGNGPTTNGTRSAG